MCLQEAAVQFMEKVRRAAAKYVVFPSEGPKMPAGTTVKPPTTTKASPDSPIEIPKLN
jgi:hypothetical protein